MRDFKTAVIYTPTGESFDVASNLMKETDTTYQLYQLSIPKEGIAKLIAVVPKTFMIIFIY
jgi:hypothetical protein